MSRPRSAGRYEYKQYILSPLGESYLADFYPPELGRVVGRG
jgi:hypothetical protein